MVIDALGSGISHVLIFEDDVVFTERCQEKFSIYKEQLPDDWDMVFFGVLHLEDPIVVSDNVLRIRKAYSTYAYALRDTVYVPLIELNTKAENTLDVNNFVLQERFNCYCFTPHLASRPNAGPKSQAADGIGIITPNAAPAPLTNVLRC